MKTILLSALLISSVYASAQNVNIPDVAFKNHLVNFTTADVNNDGEISYSEAFGYIGTMNLNGVSVYDMTGIEAFGQIGYINVSGTPITSLNTSGNFDLIELDCTNCSGLTSLDLSNNVFIQDVKAPNCSLNSLLLPNSNS